MDTSKPITMDDAIGLFKKGHQVVVVEYRNSVAETITWRDKESQKAMSAPILRHNVETETGPMVVDERQGEGFRPEDYKAPFKKGQRCLLHFNDMETQRGVLRARGVLQPLS
jgi:hypothetical protein